MQQEGRPSLPIEPEKSSENSPQNGEQEGKVKIYLLPNLFTAGNLACGFFALTWIFKYEGSGSFEPIQRAIWLILLAFVFDFFDGRLARMGGRESQFGREFDSLADMVSFGVAPAFLVHRIVLHEFEKTGWIVASIYVVCSAARLARFNVLSLRGAPVSRKEFYGFPTPSAAGLVVSLTMLMMWLAGEGRPLGAWRFALPILLLLLSGLMISNVKYPTFKQIDWTTQKSFITFVAVVVAAIFLLLNFQVTLAFLFVAYLLYGLARPWVSKRWRREIEADENDDESTGT
jgi:CDP-diacylglycerol--serine O-phosphatidyltransferase